MKVRPGSSNFALALPQSDQAKCSYLYLEGLLLITIIRPEILHEVHPVLHMRLVRIELLLCWLYRMMRGWKTLHLLPLSCSWWRWAFRSVARRWSIETHIKSAPRSPPLPVRNNLTGSAAASRW